MRHRNSGGLWHSRQWPIQEGVVMAAVTAMTVLGLLWGREAAAFLGPPLKGLSQHQIASPDGGIMAASVRSASAGSLHGPRTFNGGRADARVSNVFWACVMVAGVCSIRRMALGSASKRKSRVCAVSCQAADVQMPVLFQPHMPMVNELKPTPATTSATLDVMQQCTLDATHAMNPQRMLEVQPQHNHVAPSTLKSQMQAPRPAACRATMVGAARFATAARSAARRARHQKAANTAAAARAARRALGSRLQAASCQQDVPSVSFDASRQRWKIQAGLQLAKRVRFGHMREMRSVAGVDEKSNGLFTTIFGMIEDLT